MENWMGFTKIITKKKNSERPVYIQMAKEKGNGNSIMLAVYYYRLSAMNLEVWKVTS